MSVKIVVDTTACLPAEYVAEHDLPLIPQIIIFGEASFRDDTEINLKTFLDLLQTSVHFPKTAAPPPSLYNPVYKSLSEAGHTILVIAPSAGLSGTVRSATTAAQDFPNADIHVYDTQTITGGLASMIKEAVRMAESGETLERILARLDSMKRTERTYFLVDTLKYLEKGGRIGKAQALVGSMLQVKPILALKDGQVVSHSSQRTQKKAIKYLLDQIRLECPHRPESYLNVMQAGAEEKARELASMLEEETYIRPVPVYDMHMAIVVHAGPGVIAFNYFVNEG